MSLLIGIPSCAKLVNEMPMHQTPARYAAAVVGGVGGLPVLIPPVGEIQLGLLDHLDGLLIPGSPSNVHPMHYDGGDSETPAYHDMERDHTTLPLIRGAIAAGVAVLAICRGIQELNVAMGGSLIQRVHERAGRLDHRGGAGPQAERYGPKHPVRVTGTLAQIVGSDAVMVNSVHGQAIDRLAERLVVEAVAPDGTIEAVRLQPAPGSDAWVLGVQWHPEWRYADNPDSMAIFRAFAEACRARQRDRLGRAGSPG